MTTRELIDQTPTRHKPGALYQTARAMFWIIALVILALLFATIAGSVAHVAWMFFKDGWDLIPSPLLSLLSLLPSVKIPAL